MLSTKVVGWLSLIFGLSICISNSSSKEIRVVCYYTNWSVYRPGTAKFSPQNINPYLCTHLIYAFGGFTKENTLKPFDKYQDIEKGGYAKFTGLKTYNKDLKTMLAIGGWNEASSRFSPMVASADRRKQLVKNSIKFLRQNNFDGLDLDWEYPAFREGGKSRDKENYAKLVQELREEFERESEKTGRTRLLLTMAVPAGIEYVNKGYDIPKLTKYLDWMNILSYDYHSAFEPSVNHHAPLYPMREATEYDYDAELNIDYTIKHYLELGADPSKLVMGVPTYGRSYTLFNPDANAIGDPADGPGEMGEATRENGYLAYYEICENIKSNGWNVIQPNEKAMGPYAFKENQWVGFDDENIARKKAEYVAQNGLGGIMFWAIDNDDFRGSCHGKPYPLIEAAKEALIAASGLTDDNLISPPAKTTKHKSRLRSRTKTTEEPKAEKSEVPTKSNGSRRRNRLKPKVTNRVSDSEDKIKSRRNEERKLETTSTYSSLKVITPAYTTPEPPSTPDQGGAFKCEDEGFYPHPKDCKKYFWCLSGPGESGIVAHQFTCPAGLYFNKAADSCDYSQNVLCNKKLSKTTSTTEGKEIQTTTQKTSTRAPITRTTTRTTTTTEEEYDDEFEYEDEEISDAKSDSEEDPKVIKELLDLIKKAGGIEELEKQLNFGHDEVGEGATTPSTRTKSIVEKFLTSRTNKISSGTNKYSTINRNSRGPQNAGIEKDTNDENTRKIERKPQYTTISRKRPASSDDRDEVQAEEKEQELASPRYTTIRRSKEGLNQENRRTLDRNKILGEDDKETEDSNRREVTVHTTPQYVNIRRQRPTTEQSSTTQYVSIRRSTTDGSPKEDEKEEHSVERDQNSDSPVTEKPTPALRYQTLNRSATSTPQISSTTLRSTTPLESSSTNQPSSISNDVQTESSEIPSTISSKSTDAISTSTTETAEEATFSSSTTSSSIATTTEEIKIQVTKSPVLYEPRPFSVEQKSSISTTHKPVRTIFRSTTNPTKVSETSVRPRFRIRPSVNKNIENNGEGVSDNGVESENSSEDLNNANIISRSRSRTSRPEAVKNEDTTASSKPIFRQRIRPTFSSSTQKTLSDKEQDEIQRKYRPLSLDDLSSLTAADIVIQRGNKEGEYRRSRLRSTTTESPEKEISTVGRRTFQRKKVAIVKTTTDIPASVTRKSLNESQDEINKLNSQSSSEDFSSSESSEKKLSTRTRFFGRTRLSPVITSTTELNNDLTDQIKSSSDEIQLSKQDQNEISSSTEIVQRPSKRTRKVLKRLRTPSLSTTSATVTKRGKPLSYASLNLEVVTTTDRLTSGSNILVVDSDSNEANISDETTEEEENIKLSATNIRENSNINTDNAIYDIGFRKFKKADVVYDKTRYGTKYNDVTTISTTTESGSTRTRKIIRRLRPTEKNSVEELTPFLKTDGYREARTNESARGRKIIRRLRPGSKSISIKNNLSDTLLINNPGTIELKNQAPQFFERKRVNFNRDSGRIAKTPSFKRKFTTAKEGLVPTEDIEEDTETMTQRGKLRYFDIVRSTAPTTTNSFKENEQKPKIEGYKTFYFTTSISPTIQNASEYEPSSIVPIEETSTLSQNESNEMETIGTEDYISETTSTPYAPFESTTEFDKNLGRTNETSFNISETISPVTISSVDITTLPELSTLSDSNNILPESTTYGEEIISTQSSSTEDDGTNAPEENDSTTYSNPETTSTTTTTEYIRRSTLRTARLRPTYPIRRITTTTTTKPSKDVKASEKTPKFFTRKKPSFRQRSTTESSSSQNSSSEKPRRRYPFSKYGRFSTTTPSSNKDDIETTVKISEEQQYILNNKAETPPIEIKGESEEGNSFGTTTENQKLFNKFAPTESYSTTSENSQQLNLDSAEKQKLRNKSLFSKKRKMNIPIHTSNEVKEESTTEHYTTLYHVFAEPEVGENETKLITKNETHINAGGRIEPIVEINRIIEVHIKNGNGDQSSGDGEAKSIFDKIGAINRITSIKVVDRNGTKIADFPLDQTSQRLAAVHDIIEQERKDEVLAEHRKDRKFNFNVKIPINGVTNDVVRPEIIDGISHIKVITPKPALSPEVSTIALEALFSTTEKDKTNQENTSATTIAENELLDTEYSRFVNIRIIKPADGRSLDEGGTPADTPQVVKILPNDEEMTMKAKVVEVTPKNLDQIIRIAPIQVAMARSIADTPIVGISKLNEKIGMTPFRPSTDTGVQ